MTKELGNRELMAKNIKRYLDKKGMTGKDLADMLCVPATTVYSWLQGKSYPRIDKIEMMANFFGISKADLVEAEKEEKESPEMRMLLDAVKDCTPEEILQIVKIVKALRG